MSQSKTLKEKIDDFSNKFEDIIIGMQNILIDIQLRNFEWEKRAQKKYEESEAYINEVDALIGEIFSTGDLSQPEIMEKATQFLVSYKPQIETFRGQIKESLTSPGPEFKFNDDVDESLEDALKQMEEAQKKVEEENANKKKEEEEDEEEESEGERDIDEEQQVKLAAELLNKEFQDSAKTNEEEEEENNNQKELNINNEEEEDNSSSEEIPEDPLRKYALDLP